MPIITIEQLRAAWKRGGKIGGRNRSKKLTAKRRREIARMGGLAAARKNRKG